MKIDWLDRTALRLPHLLLCTTELQYLGAMEFLNIAEPLGWIGETAAAGTHTLYNQRGQAVCVVCIPILKSRPTEALAAILAHEAVHVAQNLFESIGESKPGREIEAYAVQNIVEQLMISYKKQSKRKLR